MTSRNISVIGCGGLDDTAMAGEHGELRTRARIPAPCGLVNRGGDDARAIGQVGGGIDEIAQGSTA